MTACLVALGSNQGDRIGALLGALDVLRRNPAIRVAGVSSFFETMPVGGPAGQEKFFNAAARLETELGPTDLLAVLLDIEQRHGRQRREVCGPRTLDLDLLLYGDHILE